MKKTSTQYLKYVLLTNSANFNIQKYIKSIEYTRNNQKN